MSEVRNGEQKGIKVYIPKYFMAVRNCINIFGLSLWFGQIE